MHVLFIAPDTNIYNQRFVEALKRAGATVSAVGHSPVDRLKPELKRVLDAYQPLRSLFDGNEVIAAARELNGKLRIDQIETVDEPLIGPAAHVRSVLGLPGLTPEQAKLCRDKQAMKELMRRHGVPCAASSAVSNESDVRAFIEREGYPIVLKPRDGFGTLHTYRVDDEKQLQVVLGKLKPGEPGRSLIAEEFIDGHEGFYDTVTVGGKPGHDFIAHYYPGCLEAIQDRRIAPQIACTNRVDESGYRELRRVGARLIEVLGIDRGATHMEWFFGSKGLKIGEIGVRPAGERIWDMHQAGNEFDLYSAWADAVLFGRHSGKPSRRYATGSVQVRPDRDGLYQHHLGLDEVRRLCGDHLIEFEVPDPGAPTQPMDKGWHVNTWFRLRHTDYDTLREMLTFIGNTVKAVAR